jgi:hypothetical protein
MLLGGCIVSGLIGACLQKGPQATGPRTVMPLTLRPLLVCWTS